MGYLEQLFAQDAITGAGLGVPDEAGFGLSPQELEDIRREQRTQAIEKRVLGDAKLYQQKLSQAQKDVGRFGGVRAYTEPGPDGKAQIAMYAPEHLVTPGKPIPGGIPGMAGRAAYAVGLKESAPRMEREMMMVPRSKAREAIREWGYTVAPLDEVLEKKHTDFFKDKPGGAAALGFLSTMTRGIPDYVASAFATPGPPDPFQASRIDEDVPSSATAGSGFITQQLPGGASRVYDAEEQRIAQAEKDLNPQNWADYWLSARRGERAAHPGIDAVSNIAGLVAGGVGNTAGGAAREAVESSKLAVVLEKGGKVANATRSALIHGAGGVAEGLVQGAQMGAQNLALSKEPLGVESFVREFGHELFFAGVGGAIGAGFGALGGWWKGVRSASTAKEVDRALARMAREGDSPAVQEATEAVEEAFQARRAQAYQDIGVGQEEARAFRFKEIQNNPLVQEAGRRINKFRKEAAPHNLSPEQVEAKIDRIQEAEDAMQDLVPEALQRQSRIIKEYEGAQGGATSPAEVRNIQEGIFEGKVDQVGGTPPYWSPEQAKAALLEQHADASTALGQGPSPWHPRRDLYGEMFNAHDVPYQSVIAENAGPAATPVERSKAFLQQLLRRPGIRRAVEDQFDEAARARGGQPLDDTIKKDPLRAVPQTRFPAKDADVDALVEWALRKHVLGATSVDDFLQRALNAAEDLNKLRAKYKGKTVGTGEAEAAVPAEPVATKAPPGAGKAGPPQPPKGTPDDWERVAKEAEEAVAARRAGTFRSDKAAGTGPTPGATESIARMRVIDSMYKASTRASQWIADRVYTAVSAQADMAGVGLGNARNYSGAGGGWRMMMDPNVPRPVRSMMNDIVESATPQMGSAAGQRYAHDDIMRIGATDRIGGAVSPETAINMRQSAKADQVVDTVEKMRWEKTQQRLLASQKLRRMARPKTNVGDLLSGGTGQVVDQMGRLAGYWAGLRAARAAGVGGGFTGFVISHILGRGMAAGMQHYVIPAARRFVAWNGKQLDQALSSLTHPASVPGSSGPTLKQILTRAPVAASGGAEKRKKATDLGQAALNKSEEILAIASDPKNISDRLYEGLAELRMTDPEGAAAATKHYVERIQFLASKAIKRPPFVNPLVGNNNWRPNDDQSSSFGRYYAAATDPAVLIEEIKTGRVWPETLETVRKLYPRYYDFVRGEVFKRLTDRKSDLPFYKRLAVSAAFGLDGLEPTFDKTFRSSYQEILRSTSEKEQQDPQQRTGRMGGYTMSRKIKSSNVSQATSAQKLGE